MRGWLVEVAPCLEAQRAAAGGMHFPGPKQVFPFICSLVWLRDPHLMKRIVFVLLCFLSTGQKTVLRVDAKLLLLRNLIGKEPIQKFQSSVKG